MWTVFHRLSGHLSAPLWGFQVQIILIFWIGIFVFILLIFQNFYLETTILNCVLKQSPSSCLSLTFFCRAEAFNFNKVQLYGSRFWFFILKSHCQTQGHLDFLLAIFQGVYSFTFYTWFCYAFWVNFCIRYGSRIIFPFCIWVSSFSSTTYWKDCHFSMELPLLLCKRQIDHFWL